MNKMKKWLATLLCLSMCGSVVLSSGCSTPSGGESSSSQASSSMEDSSLEDSSLEDSSSAEGETEESWHEERSGYKFCGYYKDRNFKYPVTEIVTEETAKNYYPKYQLDRVQQMLCASTDLDYTIYAHSVRSAIVMYLSDIYARYDIDAIYNGLVLHNDYGFEDVEATGWWELEDHSQTYTSDYRSVLISYYRANEAVTRNNTWSAYVAGDVQVTSDAWVYEIVDGQYAAVVGCAVGGSMSFDRAYIPESIDGYPVKVVSLTDDNVAFCGETGIPKVGTLQIPSTVEDVRIMFTQNSDVFPLENVVIGEGVKTVRISAFAAKNISIPSTAYFVDINYGFNTEEDFACMEEQSITVAENGHYYTKNGCLYSKEGDLVYQFTDKRNPELHIDENAKRLLPYSLTGVAKNIYIPDGLEYCDWLAFGSSARKGWTKQRYALSLQKIYEAPVFFIGSPKVAEQMIMDTVWDGTMNYPVMLYNKDVDMISLINKIWDTFLKKSVDEGIVLDEEMLAVYKQYFFSALQDSGIDGYNVFAMLEEESPYLRVEDNVVYLTLENIINGTLEENLLTYLDYTNVADYSFDSVFEEYLQQ